jgi:hypothetical protein
MDQHKTRAAAAFAALTAKLYQAAGEDTPPAALNPFVLLAGPELLRRPWLEQYFDRAIVREIHAAMQGREELYGQMHDLRNLLRLQTHPLTPDTQRAVSQGLAQEYDVFIPPKDIVWMTDQDIEAASTRLTAFMTTQISDPELVRYVNRHVPLVLSTANREHTLRPAKGRTVRIHPMQLAPHALERWFQERLLHAVDMRLTGDPENPLWVLPDGRVHGFPLATRRQLRELTDWLDWLCTPKQRTRPPDIKSLTKDEFYARWPAAVAQAQKWRGGRRIRNEDIARDYPVSLSTFYRYLHDYGRPPLS